VAAVTSKARRARPLRRLLQAAAVFLPFALKRFIYTRLLGWRVDPAARVGFSYLDAESVVLEAGARIGHITVVRELETLHVASRGEIGNWNWITAARALVSSRSDGSGAAASFRIEREAALTHRHYVDCTGGITIGELATVAGVRSTLLTHQIDPATARQTTASIWIGDRSLVSSNVCITPGARVPARSLVAMGSVVLPGLTEEGVLYAGVPARMTSSDLQGARYFSRERGWVAPVSEHE
jgi:acetyltransferase-like isoleucine patch superfamily enzyme